MQHRSTFHISPSRILLWVLLAYTWIPLTSPRRSEDTICPSIDAKNDVTGLDQLRDCTVVEGSIQIVLMDKMTEEDFEPYSFPKLREVTHYLLLFWVRGLRSLGKLFPNLEKIGGENQFNFFSLIVYEMFSLQEIGLANLREISAGSVIIDKSPKLCFVNTVQWSRITKWNGDLNKLQKQTYCPSCPENCPSCPESCPDSCWNSTLCQEVTRFNNCNFLCVGDCDPQDPSRCYTCKGYFDLEGNCVRACPANTYQYLNRRCVTKDECTSIKIPNQGNEENEEKREQFYVIHENQCLDKCPSGEEPDTQGICPPCKGKKCIKLCRGEAINSAAEAWRYQGCTYIRGSIEITIKDNSDEVYSSLEESLGSIEQITGYLKVTRSSVKNLNFLKNLSVIHGIDGNQHNVALVVTKNENLQELWDWKVKKHFMVVNGKLSFHYNPKLCLNQIKRLVEVIGYKEGRIDIDDVSNGNDFQCNPIKLVVSVADVTSNSIRVHIPYAENVLRYVVYYIKDVHENVTMFNGFTQCSDDGWRTKDISVDYNDTIHGSKGTEVVLTDLDPATTYVFYATSYTMYNNGTRSGMQRRTTLPTTPSEVIGLKAFAKSHTEIELMWEPPQRVNGKLKEFVITWYELNENVTYIYKRNYCLNPVILELSDSKEGNVILQKNFEVENTKNKSCCKTQQTLPKDEFEMLCGDLKNVPTGISDAIKYPSCKSLFYSRIYNSPFYSEDKVDFKTLNPSTIPNHSEHYAGTKLGLKKVSTTQNQIFNDDHKTNSKHLDDLSKEQVKYKIKQSVRLPHTTRNVILNGLKHFQNYVIYIKACREFHENEVRNKSLEDYRCSISEVITVRTKEKKELDAIPYSNVVSDNNKGYIIKWASPKNPNGVIVAFELEYRLANSYNGSGKYMTNCLTYSQYDNSSKQHFLDGLPAGKYEVRIRAISLFGEGPYTKPIPFEIDGEIKNPLPPFFLFSFVACCFIILIAVIMGTACCYKPNKGHRGGVVIVDVNPNYQYVPDHYEIDRDDVEFGKELGTGSFGKVYDGLWKSKNLRCAIKTVNQGATAEIEHGFLIEASVMKSMTKANFIVEIYGVVSQQSPPLVLMELMEMGDLKEYLRTMRETKSILNSTKIKMALEIADGMAYMEAHKFVHRDLAARNCMVSADLTVKVGDFGMARDIYETDYYRKTNQGFLPIRWMAPESLWDGEFTSQSDIWSYGVVLWEIVTMAEQPYQGSSNDEVIHDVVIDGKRLEIPKTSPVPLKQLMSTCWSTKPSSRSSFMNIVGSLDYYHDEEFRRVAFYHSVEAGSTRRAAWEYVDMDPVADPLMGQPVPPTSYRLAAFDEETTFSRRPEASIRTAGGKTPPCLQQTREN